MTAIAIVGPTASGKSDVAIEIAAQVGGEIVSVDSMQVYRGMDIGTAKASEAMQRRVPHHMIDIREPNEDMSVAEFQAEGRTVLDALAARAATPVICGGSGLHFRALVDPLRFPPNDPGARSELEKLPAEEARRRLVELDPAAGDHVDLANPRRVVRALEVVAVTGQPPSERARSEEARAVREYQAEVDFLAIGLDPGPVLPDLVVDRFDAMLEAGLLDEVAGLLPRLGTLAAQAVGYKELAPVVTGSVGLEEARESAISATRALAKRQRTFFRRDPRIAWLPWDPDPAVRAGTAIDHLSKQASWNS